MLKDFLEEVIFELSQRMEKLEDQRKYMGKEGKGTLERGNDSKSSGDGVVGGWVDMVESTQLQAIRKVKMHKAIWGRKPGKEVRAIKMRFLFLPWSSGFSPLTILQS